jgi:hypothetical protein
MEPGVGKRVTKGRSRRLAVAALAWSLFLLLAAVFADLIVSRPQPRVAPDARSIRVEQGRLPVVDAKAAHTRVDYRLGDVVTALAHRSATVYCASTADWKRRASEWAAHWPWLGELGPWRAYTLRETATVHLSPAVCAQLTRLVRSRGPVWRDEWPDALAWSIYALAHEAIHVSGIRSEVKADCHGMQSIAQAAVMLGRTSAEGAYLATLYLKHWHQGKRPAFRSRECRNGGRLDLHPRSAIWP